MVWPKPVALEVDVAANGTVDLLLQEIAGARQLPKDHLSLHVVLDGRMTSALRSFMRIAETPIADTLEVRGEA